MRERESEKAGGRRAREVRQSEFISQKVFMNSFCRSQFTHKYVDLIFVGQERESEREGGGEKGGRRERERFLLG